MRNRLSEGTFFPLLFVYYYVQMRNLGQFGYLEIWANNHKVTYPLNTLKNGINGLNQQCLLYYYHMSIIPGTVDKITVRKEEQTGTSTIIDTVSSSPINRWIRRNVTFTSTKAGYKVIPYFSLLIEWIVLF